MHIETWFRLLQQPICTHAFGKISLTSPVIINVPTRASLAVETKGLLFLWSGLAHLKNKSNVCEQISSPYECYSHFCIFEACFNQPGKSFQKCSLKGCGLIGRDKM